MTLSQDHRLGIYRYRKCFTWWK